MPNLELDELDGIATDIHGLHHVPLEFLDELFEFEVVFPGIVFLDDVPSRLIGFDVDIEIYVD